MPSMNVNAEEAAEFLQAHFGTAPYVAVRRTRAMPNGLCYGNVREVVMASGGVPVWGWALLERPGRFLEAMHHAVWRNADGDLEDVTYRNNSDDEATTLFIPDPTTSPQPTDPIIASKYRQIDRSNSVRYWIDGNIERMRLMRERKDLIQGLDHVVLPDGRIGIRQQLPVAFVELDQRIQAQTTKLLELDRRMSAGFYE